MSIPALSLNLSLNDISHALNIKHTYLRLYHKVYICKSNYK